MPAGLGTLEHLESLNIEGSGLKAGNSQNSLKQYLPSWLQFDTYVGHSNFDIQMSQPIT